MLSMNSESYKKSVSRKVVLHVGGGIMAGIFSAGVVTSLEEENMYPYIEAVYGSSVGVIVGAYFLANQSKLGSSIFYEDLIHDFITPLYVPLGIYDRFWNRFIKKLSHKNIRSPVDIDYAMDIITKLKKINIDEIQNKKIPFYAYILNIKNLKAEFINITNHKDPLRIIKAAVSAAPYYFSPDLEYIDGAIENHFPITEILRKYPYHKITSIMNIVPNKVIRRSLKSILEGAVSSLMYGTKIWKVYLQRDFITSKEIQNVKKDSRTIIISPPRELKLWPNTTGKAKLLRAYEAGREEGKRIAHLIKFLKKF